MSVEFKATQSYDQDAARQYLNGELVVLHCHHYSALFTQLADDAKLLKGAKLLAQSAEETFYDFLNKYYADNGISTLEDRLEIAAQYCRFIGLGTIEFSFDGNSGTAAMPFSHVDEGWIKKWSTRKEPVNFIGTGFIAAACSAATDSPVGTFKVSETQSIVAGADVSKFNIAK